MKTTVFNTMKQRVTMSKVSKLLLLISLSFLFIFTSCDNLFENSVSEESSSKQKKEQTEETPEYVTISGKLDVENLKGALPSQMLASKDEGSSKRSAIFSIPGGTDYEYYITATSSKGEKVITPQANASGVISYTFTLETGVQWTFKAGFRNKNNPEQILLQDKDTLAGSPFTKTFTVSNPGYTHTFTLLASQSEGGKGKVDLSMVIEDSDIVDLKLFKQDGNPWMEDKLDISTASSPFSIKSKNDAFNIPSGSYSVTFVFYKKYSNLDDEIYQAYITYQTISVFDNMETKVWMGGKSSGSIITEDGTFKLTDDLISSFANTTLYVGKPAGTPSTVTVSDDNSGGAYAPLETFGEALKRIENHDKAAPYQIFISGEQKKSGGYTISNNITTAKASSITVTGLGNDAVLNAQDDGSVLSVNSSVPLTLNNLKITGGSAENGGGINVTASNASLYLGDGMVIAGNTATGNGGGINLGGANSKLFMYGNSVIGEYQALDYYSLSSDESYFVNKAVNGGGIYIGGSGAAAYIGAKGFDSDGNIQEETSKVCYISKNYATNGGGIYNAAGTVKFYKMNVNRNRATASGGGLYIAENSVESDQRGGSFYKNAAVNGGGVYICDGATYALNGTVGTSTYPNTATTYGGAVYNAGTIKLESAAVIDHGNGLYPKTNDVYLANISGTQKTITLATTALTSSQSIAVTISDWKHGRGKQILSTTDDVTISSTLKGKFKTTENGWDLKNDTDNKITMIDAPIYVAGEETRYTCKGSGYSTPSDDDSTSGTKYHPFKTILEACKIMDDKDFDYTVYIDGEIKGAQTIPDTLKSDGSGNYNAKSVDIQGCNSDLAKDILNGNSSGSALTINTAVPVYLSKMTVTGGNSTANGGGINITASGALVDIGTIIIKGNKAAKGGGLYVASDVNVYVHNNVTIGNSGINTTSDGADILSTAEKTAAALSSGLNIAANGGGIYNDGEIHFGNQRYKSGTIYAVTGSKIYLYGNVASVDGGAIYSVNRSSFNASNDYYLRYNYAAQKGGGIYQGGSLPQSTTGSNRIYVENNKAESGGGIYVAAEKQFSLCSGNSIMSNTATSGGGFYNAGTIDISRAGGKIALNTATNGGGIYNAASATVDMSKGKIGGPVTINNEEKPGYNTATNGGAVYVCVSSKFQITGDAVIPVDSSLDDKTGKNDVYLQKNDDGEASIYFPGFGYTLSGTAPVATITPAEWKRGTKFLTTGTGVTNYFTTGFINKFAMSKDNFDWDQKLDPSNADYPRFLYITMPVYVASSASDDTTRKRCNPASDTGANGTASKPYATIAAALAEFTDTNAEAEITIDGNVIGAQTIGTVNASKLTLTGYIDTANGATASLAKLNGNKVSDRTTLTVNASSADFPVIINNLTITGGKASNGAGINITKGTVKLTDGAVVTGNTATGGDWDVPEKGNGGGVYVSSNGSLFMYGKALIGDSATATGQAYANEAYRGAGIYNDGGAVYIGYDTSSNPSAVYSDSSVSPAQYYGIRRNKTDSGGYGAAIYHKSGILKIASGDISYNTTDNYGTGGAIYSLADAAISGGTITHNYGKNGGALYIKSGEVTLSGNTLKLTGNQAALNGGAIYNEGTLTLNGGTIGASDEQNYVSSNYGGAVYNNGTFNIGGTNVSINPGSAQTNDIYIAENKPLTVTDTLPTGAQISITPDSFTRGKKLIKTSSTYADELAKFTVTKPEDATNNEWRLYKPFADGTDRWARLDADLWVASAGSNSGRASSVSEPSETASERKGTKEKPYATIDEAVAQVWDDGTSKTVDFVVNISGEVIYIDNMLGFVGHKIDSSVVNAKSITLQGDANATKRSLLRRSNRRDGYSDHKSVLTIETAVPVTIKNLTIAHGYKSDQLGIAGAGICVDHAGASLTLTEGAVIKDNDAGYGAAGIAIRGTSESPATLIMNSTAAVYGNQGGHDGGAIQLIYTNMCMSGNAIVGAVASDARTDEQKNHSTGNGGGVNVDRYSSLYLGYAKVPSNPKPENAGDALSPLTEGYGVVWNRASDGCGIYCQGSLYMASGSISDNQNDTLNPDGEIVGSGGGVYITSTGNFNMYGGNISGNKAQFGGGVLVENNFYMYGGSIGASAPVDSNGIKQTAKITDGKYSNYAGKYGGGIYFSGTNLRIQGGTIEYNSAAESGGGIYLYYKDGTLSGNDETHLVQVNYNYAGGSTNTGGGGVYAQKCELSLKNVSMTGNKANYYGGAIYLPGDSSNHYMSVQGKIDIPYSGTKKNNDICLGTSGSTFKNYVKVIGALSSSPAICGTLTSDSGGISASYQYVQKQGNTINLEDVSGRFALIDPSNPPQLYMMGGAGKPVVVHALSTGSNTAVGKIVLNNGMVVSNTASLSTAMKEMAIAVIFYKGSGLHNQGGSGYRILGLGLEKTAGPLCKTGSQGTSKSITDIESNASTPFSGTVDGTNNGQKILDAVTDDSEENYPAIYYANNYSSYVTNLGDTYQNGWYIPSIAEVHEIYNNKDPVNTALTALGIAIPGCILSSSSPVHDALSLYGHLMDNGNITQFYRDDGGEGYYYWPIKDFYAP